ncbi:MAG: VanW family protein [bacterium]|nr:VanW family protein [bacterium]
MNERGGKPFLRAVFVLVLFAVAILVAGQFVYADRVLPGVTVGGLNVGGKSEDDVRKLVTGRTESIKALTFRYQDQEYTFSAKELGLTIDTDATAAAAMQAGREDPLDTLSPFVLGMAEYESPLRYQLNRSALRQKLLDRVEGVTTPARNARIVRVGDDFVTEPESEGSGVDVDQAVRDANHAVEHFDTEIALRETTLEPAIVRSQLAGTLGEARMLAGRIAVVEAGERTFYPDQETVREWVAFRVQEARTEDSFVDHATIVPTFLSLVSIDPDELDDQAPSKRLAAVYDRDAIGTYVRTVADQVDRPAVNGRLAFEGGRITFSGESKDGVVVDRARAVEEIATKVRADEIARLPIREEPAQVSPANLDRLGLKTLVGSATTTFEGSPANRTYNISVGAAKFDGVLIKPGEEFSFNGTLGEVGPETGYVEELVILENRTEPQYGGGLCQVSTTMFRAALDAGLPITARTNHSYAVHYYAPIGMDATIYPPYPDMRFVNNTQGHILVQTSVSGQSITYQFFGTADGRKANTEIVHINATEEGGGTASFRYVVEGGPDPIDRVFYSSYQPRKAFPLPGEQSLN